MRSLSSAVFEVLIHVFDIVSEELEEDMEVSF